jgi:hypothetical protein
MARPKEPATGTKERLELDLARFGATYVFVERHMRRSGGGRGAKSAAIRAAADHLEMEVDRVKRHHARVRRSMTPDAVLQLHTDALKQFVHIGESAMSVIDRAFTEKEQNALENVSHTLVLEFAQLRLAQRSKRTHK